MDIQKLLKTIKKDNYTIYKDLLHSKAILSFYNPDFLLLHGSILNGDISTINDLDFIFISKSLLKKPLLERINFFKSLITLNACNIKIDIIPYTLDEYLRYLKNVTKPEEKKETVLLIGDTHEFNSKMAN